MEKFSIFGDKDQEVNSKNFFKKGRARRKLEKLFNNDKDKFATLNLIQDTEHGISDNNHIIGINQDKSEETSFNLEQINELRGVLSNIATQLDTLEHSVHKNTTLVQVNLKKLLEIGLRLKEIDTTGSYDRTKQIPPTDNKFENAINSVTHVVDKYLDPFHSQEYRKKVDAGKQVRQQYKRLLEFWLKCWDKLAPRYNFNIEYVIDPYIDLMSKITNKSSNKLKKIYQDKWFEFEKIEREIHYPYITTILETKVGYSAIKNMRKDSSNAHMINSDIQEIVKLRKEQQTEKNALSKSERETITKLECKLSMHINEKILERDRELESRISSLSSKRASFDDPLCYVETELQDLALGKNILTLRLLQRVKSETSPDVLNALMEKLIEISALSVYEYHNQYNCKMYTSVKYLKNCYREVKKHLSFFIDDKGNYTLEKHLSKLPESGHQIVAHIHIKDIAEPYAEFIDSLKAFKREADLFFTSYSADIILPRRHNHEKCYEETYNIMHTITFPLNSYKGVYENIYDSTYPKKSIEANSLLNKDFNTDLTQTKYKIFYYKSDTSQEVFEEKYLPALLSGNKDKDHDTNLTQTKYKIFHYNSKEPFLIDRNLFAKHLLSGYKVGEALEFLTRIALYGDDLKDEAPAHESYPFKSDEDKPPMPRKRWYRHYNRNE